MTMRILVAYATRHGSTAGIAERIARTLDRYGHEAEAVPVADVGDLGGYDAVVLGGASYMFHWLKDATRFARRHQDRLREVPVWLFSSGPLGTDLVDEQGRDVLEVSRPREFDELTALLGARGERVFFGAWDDDAPPIGMTERVIRKMPESRHTLPSGDFRDWDRIEAWAREIADSLEAVRRPG